MFTTGGGTQHVVSVKVAVHVHGPDYHCWCMAVFSRMMRCCFIAAVRRPVFVTDAWLVIIALVDFAGRDQQPPTAPDIYRRRRNTVSLHTTAVRSQCDFFLTV